MSILHPTDLERIGNIGLLTIIAILAANPGFVRVLASGPWFCERPLTRNLPRRLRSTNVWLFRPAS